MIDPNAATADVSADGTKRTSRRFSVMSAFGGKADIRKCGGDVANDQGGHTLFRKRGRQGGVRSCLSARTAARYNQRRAPSAAENGSRPRLARKARGAKGPASCFRELLAGLRLREKPVRAGRRPVPNDRH